MINLGKYFPRLRHLSFSALLLEFREILKAFREDKSVDTSQILVTLNPEEAALPIDEVFTFAIYLIQMASMAEVEVALTKYLHEELKMDIDQSNAILTELREAVDLPNPTKEQPF